MLQHWDIRVLSQSQASTSRDKALGFSKQRAKITWRTISVSTYFVLWIVKVEKNIPEEETKKSKIKAE